MKNLKIFKFNFLLLLIPFLMIGCGDDEGVETPLLSKRNDIVSFAFAGITPSVSGAVNADAHTVTATVPFGTDLTSLVPTITVSDKAEIAPASGVARDFSSPVTYAVTAESDEVQNWTVTVTVSDPEQIPELTIASDPKWKFLGSESTLPTWFVGNNGERGLAYHDGLLYVTYNDDAVRILDATTGADLGQLKDDNGVITATGSSIVIGDVEVSNNGSILASNITERPGTFRIYVWNDVESTAAIFLEYANNDYRLGETLSVVGDISGDAVITTGAGRIFSGETKPGDNKILKWTVSGGNLDPTPQVIEVSELMDPFMGSIPASLPLSSASDTDIIINGNSLTFPLVIDNSGAIIDTVKYDYFRTGDIGYTNKMIVFDFQNKRYLAVYSPAGVGDGGDNVYILDITDDYDITDEEALISPAIPFSGFGFNTNATGGIAISVSEDGNTATLFHLGTNTGVWAYDLTLELPND